MNRLKNAAHFESLKFVLSMYEITDEALSDADWLDADFQVAQSRYQGTPRGNREARLSAWRKAI